MDPGLRPGKALGLAAVLSSRLLHYGLVGGVTLAIYVLAGAVFQQLSMPLALAAPGAFAVAVTVNYLLQRFWVFASRKSTYDSLPRYVVMVTVGFGINSAALMFLTPLMPLSLAQVLTAALIVISNALFAFLWVFPARCKP